MFLLPTLPFIGRNSLPSLTKENEKKIRFRKMKLPVEGHMALSGRVHFS